MCSSGKVSWSGVWLAICTQAQVMVDLKRCNLPKLLCSKLLIFSVGIAIHKWHKPDKYALVMVVLHWFIDVAQVPHHSSAMLEQKMMCES